MSTVTVTNDTIRQLSAIRMEEINDCRKLGRLPLLEAGEMWLEHSTILLTIYFCHAQKIAFTPILSCLRETVGPICFLRISGIRRAALSSPVANWDRTVRLVNLLRCSAVPFIFLIRSCLNTKARST